jgi:hypothetical protein
MKNTSGSHSGRSCHPGLFGSRAYAKSVRPTGWTWRSFRNIWLPSGLKGEIQGSDSLYLGTELNVIPRAPSIDEYRKKMDYCILGQHSLNLDDDRTYFATKPEELDIYVSRLAYACAHDLCDYICHPDVILYSYPVLDGPSALCQTDCGNFQRNTICHWN